MRISDLAAGVVLGARYRLVDIRGRGSYGDVWEVIRLDDGARVALKVHHEQERGNRALFGEASQAVGFDHPRLIRVFRAQRIDGIACLEMELVDGHTLAERLGDDTHPLYITVAQALDWMTQVAEGLAYLHELKPPVSHGDVKPANLIIGADGIKLADFGQSRHIEDVLVPTGGHGTYMYQAPETHLHGKRALASDIYSFGVVFYRVLTGRLPRRTIGEVAALSPFPRPGELNASIPAEIDTLIGRCLASTPEQRLPDGRALLTELRTIRHAHELLASTASGDERQELSRTPVAGSHAKDRPLELLDEAYRLAEAGDDEGALAALEVVLQRTSTRREVLLLYAHVAEKTGRLQVARDAFARLVRWLVAEGTTATEQREARERLGRLQVRLGEYESAIETFGVLHEAFPDDLWFMYRLGIALGLAARFRESIATLEEVRRRRPDLASVPAKIGFAYLQLRQRDLAAQYFNEALMLDANEPEALYHLALMRYVEGRVDRAELYYRRLAALDDQQELIRDLDRQLQMTR